MQNISFSFVKDIVDISNRVEKTPPATPNVILTIFKDLSKHDIQSLGICCSSLSRFIFNNHLDQLKDNRLREISRNCKDAVRIIFSFPGVIQSIPRLSRSFLYLVRTDKIINEHYLKVRLLKSLNTCEKIRTLCQEARFKRSPKDKRHLLELAKRKLPYMMADLNLKLLATSEIAEVFLSISKEAQDAFFLGIKIDSICEEIKNIPVRNSYQAWAMINKLSDANIRVFGLIEFAIIQRIHNPEQADKIISIAKEVLDKVIEKHSLPDELMDKIYELLIQYDDHQAVVIAQSIKHATEKVSALIRIAKIQAKSNPEQALKTWNLALAATHLVESDVVKTEFATEIIKAQAKINIEQALISTQSIKYALGRTLALIEIAQIQAKSNREQALKTWKLAFAAAQSIENDNLVELKDEILTIKGHILNFIASEQAKIHLP